MHTGTAKLLERCSDGVEDPGSVMACAKKTTAPSAVEAVWQKGRRAPRLSERNVRHFIFARMLSISA